MVVIMIWIFSIMKKLLWEKLKKSITLKALLTTQGFFLLPIKL